MVPQGPKIFHEKMPQLCQILQCTIACFMNLALI
uniref:Uncharacterized protein n=1 Tax=Rhizophora mucronata TaxID=61149 RepID=A0A2P2IKZ2_RHIMU